MPYKERVRNMFKFTKAGDTVEGKLESVQEVNLMNGPARQYRLITNDGHVTFLGTVVLNDMFDGIPLLTGVKVTYKGLEKSATGRPVKQFQVWVDEGE